MQIQNWVDNQVMDYQRKLLEDQNNKWNMISSQKSAQHDDFQMPPINAIKSALNPQSAAGTNAIGGTATTGSAGASGLGAVALPAIGVLGGLAEHQWAKNKGLHDDKDLLTGKAWNKDFNNYFKEKGNNAVDGLGDLFSSVAITTSPLDMANPKTFFNAQKDTVLAPFKMIKSIF